MHRKQTTEEWIHQSVSDKEKGGPCTHLAVVHYVGGQPNEVDRITFPTSLSERDIAVRFDERISNFVREMPGVQNCAFVAFYGGSNEPGATQPFLKTGKVEYEGLMSEPPTPGGLVQQVMRHKEAMTATYVQGQRQLVEGFAQLAQNALSQSQALAAENERLRKENGDAWVMVRDAALDHANRQFEIQQKVRKEERTEALVQKLLQWGPALINTIAQKKIFPQAVEDTALVEGLLSQMQPEHIQMITSFVPPEVAGLVASRAKQLFAERDRREKERQDAMVLSRGVTPESELQ